jgi:hypothetical protein
MATERELREWRARLERCYRCDQPRYIIIKNNNNNIFWFLVFIFLLILFSWHEQPKQYVDSEVLLNHTLKYR